MLHFGPTRNYVGEKYDSMEEWQMMDCPNGCFSNACKGEAQAWRSIETYAEYAKEGLKYLDLSHVWWKEI